MKNFRWFIRALNIYLILCFVLQPVFAQVPSMTRRTLDAAGKTGIQGREIKNFSDRNPEDALSGIGQAQGMQQMPMGVVEQGIKVHVLGEVEKPGVYRATVSDRLTDVLEMATPKRESTRIVQLRHVGEKTRYYDLYRYKYGGDLENNPYLQDNDVIFVPVIKGAIRVEGPVARPGEFELSGEKTVAAAVQLAGGMTSAASSEQSIKIIRINRVGERDLIDVPVTEKDMRRTRVQKGDIIVVPDVLNRMSKYDYSVESLPGENIVYPTAKPEVFVMGSVTAPGAYPYKSYMTAKEYIGFAGATENARIRSVKLIRQGKHKTVELDTPIYPGDMIVVRPKTLTNVYTVIGIVSTVLSLTITSLVLKNEFE